MNNTRIRKDDSAQTSKGNQPKWKADCFWYKADCFGYESLAETVCSHLLLDSNAPTLLREWITDDSLNDSLVTRYEPVWILSESQIIRGCKCADFSDNHNRVVPAERLFRQHSNYGLSKELGRITQVSERIDTLVRFAEKSLRIPNYRKYLTLLIEADTFFLNEDRHTNNISFFYDYDDDFSMTPFYDFGLSLFSDTKQDYPLSFSYEECLKRIEAKPFSRSFDEQLDAAEEMYGDYLRFCFPAKDIEKKTRAIIAKYDMESAYDPAIIERVIETLRQQARKYGYFFPPK